MIMNKCSPFEKAGYSCVRKVDQEERFLIHINVSARQDPGNNIKPTTVPQRTLEKQPVVE